MKKQDSDWFNTWLLTLLAAVVWDCPQVAAATTRTVTSLADDGPGTLRQRIVESGPGDTIDFAVAGTIDLTSGELPILGDLTILGPGGPILESGGHLRVNGKCKSRVFRIAGTSTVNLSGFLIEDGFSWLPGAGILIEGGATLIVSNCTFFDNFSRAAGGAIANVGTLMVHNSEITHNHALNNGGGIYNEGALTVNNSTFGRDKGENGGGIANAGTLAVSHCTFANNEGHGSGIYNVGGPIWILNTLIAEDNDSIWTDVEGSFISQGHNLIGKTNLSSGWVASDLVGSTLTPLRPRIDSYGGGAHGGPTYTLPLLPGSPAIDAGDDAVLNAPFNLTTDQRGYPRKSGTHVDIGAYEVGPHVVTVLSDSGAGSLRATIIQAAPGETIRFASNVTGTITLTSGELVIANNVILEGPGANVLTVSGNNASRVFHVTGGASQIAGLRIAGGYTEAAGGGIAMDGGGLQLSQCEINGCYADSIFGGGGIFVGPGLLSIFGSTLSGNRTPYTGGGLSVSFSADVFVAESTVSGNSAGGGFFDATGGGIDVQVGNLTITDSTVANNSSALGGGIYRSGGTVAIRNSLIAGNSAPTGPDCGGTFVSNGHNLIGNAGGSAGFGVTGDQLNVDPLIGPLQDNGGPTFTHALLPGSPAIDKGNSGGLPTDQRGGIRPFDLISVINATGGDGSDIGAFEVGSSEVRTLVVSNNNDSGPGSLRQVAEEAYPDSSITFAPNVTGTITLTTGELLIKRALSIMGPGAARLAISGNNTGRVFHIGPQGSVAISGLTITEGRASAGGGGIAMNGGSLTVSNCAITGCYAQDVEASQGGGAIAVIGSANLTIIASTLSSNTTRYAGGGLYLFNAPTVSLINSTVSGNRTLDRTSDEAWGGGIFIGNGSTLNVSGSTIANNSSVNQGGGMYKGFSGTVRVGNSLIAGNSAGGLGPDCKGTFVSAGYNLIGNSSGSTGFGAAGDQLNLNAQIGALADNGGPTLTHALLTGSPAIDKGNDFSFGTDQRGRLRPFDFAGIARASGGDDSDIGAFEFNPPVLSIARSANNVLVSWPAYDTGYTLEAKTNLNASINWSNVPGTPVIVAGQFTVTNTATTGNRFYRLRSP